MMKYFSAVAITTLLTVGHVGAVERHKVQSPIIKVSDKYDFDLETLLQDAKGGDIDSQQALGIMYEYGSNDFGIQQDYTEAMRWYRIAAKGGSTFSKYNIGRLYENGRGVPQDYVEAHKWFNLAAAQAQIYAEDRDTLASRMTPDQIAEAQRLAREWMAERQ